MALNAPTLTQRSMPPMYFWLAVFGSVGMIGIGTRGLFDHVGSAAAYGVPVSPLEVSAWVAVAAVRDLSLGLLGLTLALAKERRALGLLALVGALVPIADGMIVVMNGPTALPYVLLHWGSAFACVVFAWLLWR